MAQPIPNKPAGIPAAFPNVGRGVPSESEALRGAPDPYPNRVFRAQAALSFATALVTAGRGGDRESCLSLAIEWADALLEKLG